MDYILIFLAIGAAIALDEHISMKRHREVLRNQYKIICALEMLMSEHTENLEAHHKHEKIKEFQGEIQEQLR